MIKKFIFLAFLIKINAGNIICGESNSAETLDANSNNITTNEQQITNNDNSYNAEQQNSEDPIKYAKSLLEINSSQINDQNINKITEAFDNAIHFFFSENNLEITFNLIDKKALLLKTLSISKNDKILFAVANNLLAIKLSQINYQNIYEIIETFDNAIHFFRSIKILEIVANLTKKKALVIKTAEMLKVSKHLLETNLSQINYQNINEIIQDFNITINFFRSINIYQATINLIQKKAFLLKTLKMSENYKVLFETNLSKINNQNIHEIIQDFDDTINFFCSIESFEKAINLMGKKALMLETLAVSKNQLSLNNEENLLDFCNKEILIKQAILSYSILQNKYYLENNEKPKELCNYFISFVELTIEKTDNSKNIKDIYVPKLIEYLKTLLILGENPNVINTKIEEIYNKYNFNKKYYDELIKHYKKEIRKIYLSFEKKTQEINLI